MLEEIKRFFRNIKYPGLSKDCNIFSDFEVKYQKFLECKNEIDLIFDMSNNSKHNFSGYLKHGEVIIDYSIYYGYDRLKILIKRANGYDSGENLIHIRIDKTLLVQFESNLKFTENLNLNKFTNIILEDMRSQLDIKLALDREIIKSLKY